MTTPDTASPTGTGTHAPSPTRIATFVVAVLGLAWLGPLTDGAAGQGVGRGPGRLIGLVLDPTRWNIGPDIDGVSVVAACGAVAALLLVNSTD